MSRIADFVDWLLWLVSRLLIASVLLGLVAIAILSSFVAIWLPFPICAAYLLLFFGARYLTEHTIWWDPQLKLKRFRCPSCDGCCVQWYDPDKRQWDVIPPELRIFHGDRESFDTRPPIGNTRRCPRCHGLGHTWDTPY